MSNPNRAVERLTPEQLGTLASRLRRKRAQGARGGQIPRLSRPRQTFPLSSDQARLWFLERLEPGTATYNIAVAIDLRGELAAALLVRALRELIARHEPLRTRFVEIGGEPAQRIEPEARLDVPRIDLTGLSPRLRERETERLATNAARRPFTLGRAPLVRARLVRIAATEWTLLLTLHHLIADGWSAGVIVQETARIYAALLEGRTAHLPELPVSFVDYAAWQNERVEAGELDSHVEHWRRELEGSDAAVALPFDRPRPPARSSAGRTYPWRLGAPLAAGLDRLAVERGTTPFVVLLSGFYALLHRYSGQDDLTVASPVANRLRPELEGLVGFLANTLVLRADIGGDPAFGDLVERVRDVVARATSHQELPFGKLVEALDPLRSLGHAPLAQVMLAFEPTAPAVELPEVEARLRPLDTGTAKYDVLLSVRRGGQGGLEGFIEWSVDLFDTTTIARMAGHLRRLLAEAVADPDLRLSALPMLSRAERHGLVTDWNDTGRPLPDDAFLDRRVARQVELSPDAVALIDGDRRFTYAGLWEQARRVADRLRARGVGPEIVVGVLTERRAETVAMLLGVLGSGGAYLPLDASYPRERLADVLRGSGVALVLADGGLRELVPEAGCVVLEAEEVLGPEAGEMGARTSSAPAVRAPSNLAYLIYTSGSTGRPKGVAIPHRSAVDMVEWARDAFSEREMRGVLASTSLGFDLSVFEIFAPLVRGGTVVLADHALALEELPARDAITLVNTVPSALAELVRLRALPWSAESVNLAGEALRRTLVEEALAGSGIDRVNNLYGPSEDTTYSTWARVGTRERGAELEAPSIGRPVGNTAVYLLDQNASPVPRGAVGEVCLAGESLARGYLGNPAESASRFVPDPFSGRDGERMYRTGDLARYRADGRLDFLGRRDHQVKVRGFRIELGEIESVLGGQPGVREAVAVVASEAGDGQRLVAFWAPEEGDAEPSAEQVREALRRKLPDYMVPAALVRLDRLPRTPNGKIDRRGLPDADAVAAPSGEPDDPPRGEQEELMARIWAEELGVERIGRNDDFFALGGHSLRATRLVARVRETFGVELPLRRLFERPTLRALAAAVGEARGGLAQGRPIRPVPRGEGELPLSFEQERLWFLAAHGTAGAAYNLPLAARLRGPVAVHALEGALDAVVDRHEALRTLFPKIDDRPVQQVVPKARTRLPRLDLTGLPEALRQREEHHVAGRVARLPFDLERGPLFRLALVRSAPEEHLLIAAVHHVVADGRSLEILVEELAAHYEAAVRGSSASLPELPVQYGDYAVWQRDRFDGGAVEAAVGPWIDRLAGAPTVLELPADRPRPPVRGWAGRQVPFSLAEGEVDAVGAMARRSAVTPFMAHFALFTALLARWTGQSDLLVGVPVANRERPEVEGLIGFFADSVVLRARPAGGVSFEDHLAAVRRSALEALAGEPVPLARLIGALGLDRDPSRTPLFQVMFAVREPRPAVVLGDARGTLEEVATDTAKVDLTLFVDPSAEAPGGLIEYSSELFDPSTIQRLIGSLRGLLRAATADPSQPIAELPLLSAAERHQIEREWNPASAAPFETPVHRAVERRAAERPDGIAVVEGDAHLGYGELQRRTEKLAEVLAGHGVGADDVVGLLLERRAALVWSALAVHRAGAAYLPLDPSLPPARLRAVRSAADARVVLTTPELAAMAGEIGGEPVDAEASVRGTAAAPSTEAPAGRGGDGPWDDRAAYLVFTSGSTGEPKGVVATHRGLARLVGWHLDRYRLGPHDRAAHLAGLGFDAAVWELWPPLAAGARLELAPDGLAASPGDVVAWWRRRGVPTSFAATPLAEAVLAEVADGGRGAGLALRTLLTGGDRLRRFAPEGLPFELHNHYGPTEATVVTTAGRVPVSGDGRAPSIGRPLGGWRVFVFERGLRPVPVGSVGELCIAGDALARGYVGDPEQTAERFVPDARVVGGRLYRTGDLARLRGGGEIEFVGRMDHQVQVRGYRIEQGEVETVLTRQPGVREAAVEAPEGPTGRRLVAWVAPEAGAHLERETLDAALAQVLPEYMVPSAWVFVEALPRTPNGKIDRRALRVPSDLATPARTAPRGETEERLAGIWRDLLGVEEVGVEDDFFDLGGHSLLASQAAGRIGRIFGVELPLERFFRQPSIAALARWLDGLGDEALPADETLPAAPERPRRVPLSYAQERIWFLEHLEPGSSAYGISALVRLSGPLDEPALEFALGRLVARHEVLRTAFESEDGMPYQRVLDALAIVLARTDLSGLGAEQRHRALHAAAAQDAARPFAVDRPPLLRARLLRLGREEHAFLLSVHHIIADGWSLRLMVSELGALYRAAAEDLAEPPHPPLQYADHALAERRWLASGAAESSLAYWRDRLGGELPRLDLPTDRPRAEASGRRAGRLSLPVPGALVGQLRAVARTRGATLFMVLLAAFDVLLQRLGGQDDVIVGTPAAGRERLETEEMVGIFLNSLPIRADLSGAPPFQELLDQVRDAVIGAVDHQRVPFEKIVEEVAPRRDLGRAPLFEVLFNMLELPELKADLGGLEMGELPAPDPAPKFDLTVYVTPRGEGLALDWVYDAELFDRERVRAMLEQYRGLLEQAAARPEAPIGTLSLQAPSFARRLPDPGAPLERVWEGTVLDRLDAWARRDSSGVAVCAPEGEISYGELARRVRSLGESLRRAGVGRGDRVAIYARRDAGLAVAVLGVQWAGAAFVILDRAYGGGPLRDRLEVARPAAWIETPAAETLPSELAGWLAELPGERRIALGPGGELPETLDVPAPGGQPAPWAPDDPLYVAFTSGSLGRPRAVLGTAAPLSHFLAWHAGTFGLGAGDRFTLLSGLSHDPLLRDLFTPFWVGGTLLVPEPDRLTEPDGLVGWLDRVEATVNHLTPAVAELLCEAGPEARLPALRRVFLGGDVLHPGLVERLRELAPGATCVNYYGTTETPQAMGFQQVDAGSLRGRVPLGRGIDGVQLLVRTPGGGLAGIGELGEIEIRTPYLAAGYLGDEAATAERFLPDGLAPHVRRYRTGDLGRFLPDGTVEFAGRADDQVSIRGFRVELGELEAALRRHPDVAAAAVVAPEDRHRGRHLAAFVVPAAPGAAPDAEELRAFLRRWAPEHLVPRVVTGVDRLPTTPNGKVDRRALEERAAATAGVAGADATAPRSAAEEALLEIWKEVLGVERLGVRDDFFAMGGHSLLATRLSSRIQRRLGWDVSLRDLFDHPTVEALAAARPAAEGAAAVPALLPRLESDPQARFEPFPLTDIQQAYWVGRTGGMELGGVASHRYLELESDELDLERLEEAWNRLVWRHEMLRAVVLPEGAQRILEHVPRYRIALVDLSERSEAGAREELEAMRHRLSHQLLDPQRWPLFEIRAVALAGGRHRLMLSFDYLIADAWSFRILLSDFLALYRDPDHPLPELSTSFREYVLGVEEVRRSELYSRSRDYWMERLDELPAGPDLPFERDPATLTDQRFDRRSWTLPRDAWSRLKERALKHGLTPSGVLLTAFGEVLGTASRNPSFSLVLTLFNRLPLHPQVDSLVGDFTTTTLLALERWPGETFLERARRLQGRLWQDLDHRYMSGVEVVREMGRARGRQARAATPVVFTSTLGLGGDAAPPVELPGEVVYAVSQTPQVLLDHQVSEQDGHLHLNWDAVDEVFPPGFLDEMFAVYRGVLAQLSAVDADWRQPLRNLLPRTQLAARQRANATAAPRPRGLLHEPFLERAERHPDRPAVLSERRDLDYGELDRRSLALGHRLRQLGARPETLVAVVMEKGWEQVVAALGVLRSGAAYLPVDSSLPRERRFHLFERGEVSIVLTQPWLDAELEWPEGLERVTVDETLPETPDAPLEPVQGEDDLAYVIFTSGSTGLPKGVMIEHRAVLNTIVDVNRRFGVRESDRAFGISSLSFDLSVWDVFGILAAGGALALPSPAELRDPAAWLRRAEASGVTIWNSAPALMEMLVDAAATLPESLRLALLSGDWIPVSLPDRIRSAHPTDEILTVSLGGATEASIWSIVHPVERVDPSWPSVPYGRPLANQGFHVLDRDLEPAANWVPGQLYIAGEGLARGYWRDPERTAASFFEHPRTGERLYATGDLGRYRAGGEIEFLGREDFQVKVQGHRIELGEIESALETHPGVRRAVVTVRGHGSRDRHLVAYAVPDGDAAPEDAELREHLGAKLPSYMVPAVYVRLGELPLTPNGKVDRRALPEPEAPGAVAKPSERPPANETEERLVELFADVLDVERVGVEDEFFELGGNSVGAILLISRIREAFDVDLPLQHLLETPTVAAVAEAIARERHSAGEDVEVEALLAELEGLSDEEARAALAEEGGEGGQEGEEGQSYAVEEVGR